MLVGLGYDIHQLKKGRRLTLGGIKVPYEKGLFGHSDGDVLIHSVCDAILGAMGEEDIGIHFPDTDQKYKNISSLVLLKEVMKMAREKNLAVNNLDVTVIAQEPKISPYKKEMKKKISSTLNISQERISIKATSPEGLGVLGKGEGIACISIVSLIPVKFKN